MGFIANLIPLALGAVALYLSGDDKDDGQPKPPGPGGFEPPALDAITEVRTINGVAVRYFRPKVRDAILMMLASYYLRPSSEYGFTGEVQQQAAVFELVHQDQVTDAAGAIKASAQCAQVAAGGLAVCGSLNLPMPDDPAPRLVAMVKPDMRMILAAAGIGPYAVLLDPHQSGGASYTTPPVQKPPVIPPPPESKWDTGIPAAVRKEVQAMLDNPTASPDALEAAAAALADKYPIAAGRLLARAAELREAQRLRDIQKGGSAHVIRYGDLAYNLAKHYTGDGSRWTEIAKVPLNEGMQNTNKGPNPWHGTVYLPLSWETWAKPLPPVAKGGGSSTTTTTTDDDEGGGLADYLKIPNPLDWWSDDLDIPKV